MFPLQDIKKHDNPGDRDSSKDGSGFPDAYRTVVHLEGQNMPSKQRLSAYLTIAMSAFGLISVGCTLSFSKMLPTERSLIVQIKIT